MSFLLLMVLPGGLLFVYAEMAGWIGALGREWDSKYQSAILVAAAIAPAIALYFYLSRRSEYEADRGAVALTNDPGAFITGLSRLSRLNLHPHQWGWLHQTLLTHPSTARRCVAVGKICGLSPERVEALMNSTAEPSEFYSLTETRSRQNVQETVPTAAPAGRPRTDLRPTRNFLVPLDFAIAGAVLAFILTIPGNALLGTATSRGVPRILVIVAAAVAGGALKCRILKRRVMRHYPEKLRFFETSADKFPGLDLAALESYTTELEGLGFKRVIDFTFENEGRTSQLSNFCRLLAHPGHQCFAELGQVMSGRISIIPTNCSVLTELRDGWSVGTGNSNPNPYSSGHRLPRNVGQLLPGARPADVLRAHLELREQICEALGVSVSGNFSADAYFGLQQKAALMRRTRMKRRNFYLFLLDVDRASRNPQLVWLGDYPKIAGERRLNRRSLMGDDVKMPG